MNLAPCLIEATPVHALKRLMWSLVRRRRFRYQTVTRRGWRIHGDTTDWIQRQLYYFGLWEPNLTAWIERTLQAGDTFVDVGANIGYFTLLAAERVGPAGHVVAIEPMPDIHRHLAAHVRDNQLGNVRLVDRAAVGPGGPSTVELFAGEEGNIGSTGMLRRSQNSRPVTVPAGTLVELLTPQERLEARIIKIDVEGVEDQALRGLDIGAGGFRADMELVVEVAHEPGSIDGNEVIGYMRTLGYLPYLAREEYAFRRYTDRKATAPPPTRLTEPVTAMHNIVFSRRDVETL